jgi:signal transduction histidine kinase
LSTLRSGYLPLSQAVAGLKAWPLGLEQDPTDPERTVDRIYRVRRSERYVAERMRQDLEHAQDQVGTLAVTDVPDTDRAILRSVSAQLDAVVELLTRYETVHDAFVAGVEQEGGEPASLVPELASLRRQIDVHLRVVNRRLSKRISDSVDHIGRVHQRARSTGLSLAAVGVVLGIALLLGTEASIAPIRRLIAAAERIREGRFAERAEIRGHDEVARLARAMNAMAASIEEREAKLGVRTAELERALGELRESQDRSIRQERLAAIGRMAAQVAHEIRNPLNALGLNAEMLADEPDGGDPVERRAMVAAIRREVARLTEITESYLALGRLPPLRLEPMALAPLLEELGRFLEQEHTRAGVRLRVEVEPSLPAVLGDHAQIWQALLNVLRNAVEALGSNGGTATVRAMVVSGQVQVEIEDDGPGMPAAQVARIFDPFFSTKERGTGLGLPITQQIVLEHGGSIECRSVMGGGSTFRIRLPRAP